MKTDTRVLNAQEVCEWLRIPKSTLYKLCNEGKIPVAKVGRHWRFDRTLVEEWFRGSAAVPSAHRPAQNQKT